MPRPDDDISHRYCRQTVFGELGEGGQQRLGEARALIVGAGGLGSWLSELLVRAGVGFVRLVDDDRVDWTNIHRQAMYDEADAVAGAAKVAAAAERLGLINSQVEVEPVLGRLDAGNIQRLAFDVDLLLDATDNWGGRFLINDWCVKTGKPWVMAGALMGQGQTMTIVPGETACLRCVYDQPPEVAVTCRTAGVIGPIVAGVAAIAAAEAMKLLSGRKDAIRKHLLKLDLWCNEVQRLDTSRPRADCGCCGRRQFQFLEA